MPLFFYHPSSSASLRILLALRLKKIESIQEVVVKTFLCEKGIPRWELPTESSIAKELGKTLSEIRQMFPCLVALLIIRK